MKTRHSKQRLVEFVATSSRLAHAYRSAARRNKRLAQSASIHEFGPATIGNKGSCTADDVQVVVLSHADDDHLVLTDSRLERVVSGAFHLLFTEPATHPDQVAQWMRTTNIRSENRLHVVKVEDLEAPQVSELLGRVCSAFGPEGSRGGIIDAYLADDKIFVRGPKHRMLHVPVGSIPALKGQSRNVLQNFEVDPDGSFIYWPKLDVHLGWNHFLLAVDPAEHRKAQQRNAEFNRRYGAAIRQIREAAGISQAKVAGLTDRQIRRIEQGTSRATSRALTALARAHGLDVNAYLDKLAKVLN